MRIVIHLLLDVVESPPGSELCQVDDLVGEVWYGYRNTRDCEVFQEVTVIPIEIVVQSGCENKFVVEYHC